MQSTQTSAATYKARLRTELDAIHREQRAERQAEIEAHALAEARAIVQAMAATVEAAPRHSQPPAATQAHQPAGIAIDADTLYTRKALLNMGMPRRTLNSISRTATVRRGQYLGSAVIAALAAFTAAAPRRHPVQFPKGLRHASR